MEWFGAALSIINMTLGLIIKTPTEKLSDVSRDLRRLLSEVRDGLTHLEENPGDTSKLEDTINDARGRNK